MSDTPAPRPSRMRYLKPFTGLLLALLFVVVFVTVAAVTARLDKSISTLTASTTATPAP